MQSCFPGVLSALTIGLLVGACSGSDKSDSAPAAQTAAVVDPAPEFEVPGEYGCEGCPDSLIEEFTLSTVASSLMLQDVISDTVDDGEYYIVSDDGLAAVGGIIPTANNGSFSFEAPLFCGVQIVKCVWSNDVGSYVLVTEVTREDCTDADIQITLGWDDLGQDYELHLVKPGGRINDNATDCTWTSCINQGPDWGVQGDASDDPRKDIDNTGQYGPENIFLSRPEEGTFNVFVEHWGNGAPESDGQVTFNVAGTTTVAKVADLPSRHVWHVGTIEWPSGEVTLDGSIIDCNDDWQSGCRLALPLADTEQAQLSL